MRNVRMRTMIGAVGLAVSVSACQSGLTDLSPVESTEEASIEVMAQVMADMTADANTRGDRDGADAFDLGALALRLGVEPTELTLTFNGRPARYRAVVTGVLTVDDRGRERLTRSLVAWSAGRRPRAIFRITTPRDQSSYADGVASSSWADLTNDDRWVARSGGVEFTLESVGAPCGRDLPFRCSLARYTVASDGRYFATATDEASAIFIQAAQQGVAGIVVTR